MSLGSSLRGQKWQNEARSILPVWQTRFHQQTPERESETKPETGTSPLPAPLTPNRNQPNCSREPGGFSSSDFHPSSTPSQDSPTVNTSVQTRRARPESITCRPGSSSRSQRSNSPSSSESETRPEAAAGRKRSLSQSQSQSPASTQPEWRPQPAPNRRDRNTYQHNAQFCTLKCLLGLQNKGPLDENCPNMKLHRQGQDHTPDTTGRHCINAPEMLRLLKEQLEKDLDHNCTPFGQCGSYGAPFKLTLVSHGYTVVGKGTLDGLWRIVSREADVYRILRKAQASAVPVFLGTISLEKVVYFLRREGQIQHMLIMGWGGVGVKTLEWSSALDGEVKRSLKEISDLGIRHWDVREENILWNDELQRAIIIDFHRSDFAPRHPTVKRLRRGTRSRVKDRLEESKSHRLILKGGENLRNWLGAGGVS